jgi:hypothetical protein
MSQIGAAPEPATTSSGTLAIRPRRASSKSCVSSSASSFAAARFTLMVAAVGALWPCASAPGAGGGAWSVQPASNAASNDTAASEPPGVARFRVTWRIRGSQPARRARRTPRRARRNPPASSSSTSASSM